MSDRIKTAQYRRACLADGQGTDASEGFTLQDLVERAVDSVAKPYERDLGTDGSCHQLLTEVSRRNSCFCGELVAYEDGRKIPLVDVTADGSTWQGAIPPLDTKGTPRKFQEQSLYFAIAANHVAVIQSPSLNADKLRDFLTWLIQHKAGLAPKAILTLENIPARSAVEKLKDHPVRGVWLGEKMFTKIKEPYVAAPGEKPNPRKRHIHSIRPNNKIMQLLRDLGVSGALIDKICSSRDPGSVDVAIDISYRSRGEKDAVELVRALASLVGKSDDLNAEIRLDGKNKISGEELSIRGAINVQCPSGCISRDDAIAKLSLWLNSQIKGLKLS